VLSLVLLTLAQIGGCPYFAEETVPAARVTTTLGEFVIELDADQAPAAVTNFAQYVDDGFYDGTLFHRVVAGSLVHGGGYFRGLVLKETRTPIANEADSGLRNVRGSVAMARTDDPNSATSQFYVNLKDNPDLDAGHGNPGYAVFGQVVEGLDVVDAIGAAATGQRQGLSDVPVEDILIQRVQRTQRTRAAGTDCRSTVRRVRCTRRITMSSTGTSDKPCRWPVAAVPIASTTSSPSTTWPKTV